MSTEKKEKVEKIEQIEIVSSILTHIKDYETFSNTITMVQPIILAIQKKLPEAFDYIEARLQKCTTIPTSARYKVKGSHQQQTAIFGKYGLIPIDDWTNTQKADQMFEDEKHHTSTQLRLYEFYWFDIPHIFNKSTDGYEFMYALKENSKRKEIYSNMCM